MLRLAHRATRCISYYSYIKPQQHPLGTCFRLCCISYYSYIKPQLKGERPNLKISCISYYSYIKPQPGTFGEAIRKSCISYYSYIKPQLTFAFLLYLSVVYRTIPTSNHNYIWKYPKFIKLYIVLFLHQTTTYHA